MFIYHDLDLELEQLYIIHGDNLMLSESAGHTISRCIANMIDIYGKETTLTETFRIREDGGLILTITADKLGNQQYIKIGPEHWLPANVMIQ